MKWHRAHGTEEVDPNIHVNRAFLYPTPVLREDLTPYFEYPITTDLAVSFSLFTKPSSHHTYPECMCKQAMWMAKHLCMHTDMPEAGIPLYIGIAEDTRHIAMPYLEECNFPENKIFYVEGNESEHEWITKYEALWHEILHPYKKVVHFDVCYLIGKYPTQRINPIFSHLLKHWKTEQMMTCAPFLQKGLPGEIHPMQVRLEFHCDNPENLGERMQAHKEYWDWIAKELDSDPETEKAYWHCNRPEDVYLFRGGIYGFRAETLNAQFQNDIRRYLRFFNCDEASLGLYAKKHKWGTAEIFDADHYFRWTNLDWEYDARYGPKNFMYFSVGDPYDFWLKAHRQD